MKTKKTSESKKLRIKKLQSSETSELRNSEPRNFRAQKISKTLKI